MGRVLECIAEDDRLSTEDAADYGKLCEPCHGETCLRHCFA